MEMLLWAVDHPWLYFGSCVLWLIIYSFCTSGTNTKTKRNKLTELAEYFFIRLPLLHGVIFGLALIEGVIKNATN